VPLGTVKAQLKLPLELDWQEAGVVLMMVLPNVMVMVWLGRKPLPATVTLVPIGPWLGLKVRFGVVTANVAEAELFEVSVAVTVPVYAALATVREQLKLPLVSAVSVPEEQVVMLRLPNWRVMGWLGMKLLPVTVTLVPTGPELGLKLIAGVVTVNVAE
jgi:hypothetical protein